MDNFRKILAVCLLGFVSSRPHIVNQGPQLGPLTPAFGDLVQTPRGLASISLEGFSEDLNQDGFVDPIGQAAVAPAAVSVAAPVVAAAPVAAAAPVLATTHAVAASPIAVAAHAPAAVASGVAVAAPAAFAHAAVAAPAAFAHAAVARCVNNFGAAVPCAL